MTQAETTGAQPTPMQDPIPVRMAAIDLFDQIAFDAITLDRAFAENQKFLGLNTLDRALARMIVTTGIRRLGQIDDIIQMCLADPTKRPEPRLLETLLRLSVAQIVFMNIPDHAAVNVAVNLAEAMGLKRQKGLVNAVLRRVAREGKDRTTRQDIARLNLPDWMIEDWIKNFGKRIGLDIAYTLMGEAPLDLTLKNPNNAPEIAETLNGKLLANGTLRLRQASGSVENLPGFADGTWWVQDAAAAMPVQMMGDITGKTVIDLCAAPGGKTAQAATRGAKVTALDRSTARLDILRTNLNRLSLTDQVDLVEADGTSWQPATPVDIVLLDAPCTATGTLRRNPDIALHRTPDDVLRMTAVQARLLNNAAKMVKPGGMIVYAVCSLQTAEGEGQIENFLKRHPDFTLSPLQADEIGGFDMMINKNGCLRALPIHLDKLGGIDGFFAARLIKKSH